MQTTLLSYISFYQAKTQDFVEKHSHHIIPITAACGIALVVNDIWGKLAMGCFALGVTLAYPMIRHKITTLMGTGVIAPFQVVIVALTPILTLNNPLAGAAAAAIVIITIIDRECKLDQIQKKIAEENKEIKKQNAQLSAIYQDIKTQLDILEKAAKAQSQSSAATGKTNEPSQQFTMERLTNFIGYVWNLDAVRAQKENIKALDAVNTAAAQTNADFRASWAGKQAELATTHAKLKDASKQIETLREKLEQTGQLV